MQWQISCISKKGKFIGWVQPNMRVLQYLICNSIVHILLFNKIYSLSYRSQLVFLDLLIAFMFFECTHVLHTPTFLHDMLFVLVLQTR